MRQYFCYMSPWGAMKLHPLGEWVMGPHPSGFALGMIWTHCPFTLGMQFHCTPRAHVAKTYYVTLGLHFPFDKNCVHINLINILSHLIASLN